MHSIKIKRPSTKKTLLLVSTLAGVILLIALLWYMVLSHGSILGWSLYPDDSSNHGTNYDNPSSDQIENGAQIKNNSLNSKSTTGASGSDTPPAPKPQTDSKSVVEVSITATNQTDAAYQIRTLISSLSSNGSCTLRMERTNHATYTQTVRTQNFSSTSTCQGFDVPLSKLSSGDWKVTITFTSPDFTGSVVKTITVK